MKNCNLGAAQGKYLGKRTARMKPNDGKREKNYLC